MSDLTIDVLCEQLQAEFARDPRGKRVADLLSLYAQSGCHAWRDWTPFSAETYTRNLVHRCGSYELLLLGWEEGQESPIHDHAGQNCWMAVLDGSIEEVHYRFPQADGPLVEGNVRRFEAGQVAYISDEIALHLVRPVAGTRGVSLHLYASPIERCLIFDRGTGTANQISVGYHSVRGELCGSKTAEAVRAEWA